MEMKQEHPASRHPDGQPAGRGNPLAHPHVYPSNERRFHRAEEEIEVQGLYRILRQKDAQITEQHAQLNIVREQVGDLQTKQTILEREVNEVAVLKARPDSLELQKDLRRASIRQP